MNLLKLHSDLVALSLPHIEAYQKDLLVHDRDEILRIGGAQFLHFTGECGTHMIPMVPADHHYYPPKGETCRYLFGTAKRDHIINEAMKMVIGLSEGRWNRNRLIVHWDGVELQNVSPEEAIYEFQQYYNWITRTWREEEE